MYFTKQQKEQFCEKYTRIALFLSKLESVHDNFLTKKGRKRGTYTGLKGDKCKFTIMKKEESYCI